jgi:hypothetical protein
MTPKVKNIIIITAVAVALILVYFFFLKPSAPQANLVSSAPGAALPDMSSTGTSTASTTSGTPLPQDFLTLLLNVNNIKLNDSIFSDPAFNNLHDSSITLTPDGTEGRPNPFAQLGEDITTPSPANSSTPANAALNATAGTNTGTAGNTVKP